MGAISKQEKKSSLFSLKWKMLIVLSLVLALVNGSFAYLVYRRTTGQFEIEQANKRLTQASEFDVVLSKAFESMAAFASFIPMLSVKEKSEGMKWREQRIAAVLSEHGRMLDVEWGVEGVHYYAKGELGRPLVSWPEDRAAPAAAGLLALTGRDEAPQGRLVCAVQCVQLIALPLLHRGDTGGFLVVERSIGDSLKEFHLLSGAEVALLSKGNSSAGLGARHLDGWGFTVWGSRTRGPHYLWSQHCRAVWNRMRSFTNRCEFSRRPNGTRCFLCQLRPMDLMWWFC